MMTRPRKRRIRIGPGRFWHWTAMGAAFDAAKRSFSTRVKRYRAVVLDCRGMGLTALIMADARAARRGRQGAGPPARRKTRRSQVQLLELGASVTSRSCLVHLRRVSGREPAKGCT